MRIDRIEIDLSRALINQAGDLYHIDITAYGPDGDRTVTLQADAAGVARQRGPHDGIPLQHPYDITVDWRFVEKACEVAGFDLQGQMLSESGSNPRTRIFLPMRSRRTYMG